MNTKVRKTLFDLWPENSEYECVFTNPKAGVSLVELKHGFRSACNEAGVQDFRFHDLRHTTGTRLADAGTDAFAIAEVLGHRNLQTTRRYTHATELRKRRAVEALANYSKDGQKQ
ncbi:MAG TPA: site-specific integrase [Blastocatellia bacterium]|nr:site-specific integrase [Blastocatellia bacterium]